MSTELLDCFQTLSLNGEREKTKQNKLGVRLNTSDTPFAFCIYLGTKQSLYIFV